MDYIKQAEYLGIKKALDDAGFNTSDKAKTASLMRRIKEAMEKEMPEEKVKEIFGKKEEKDDEEEKTSAPSRLSRLFK